jgi:hypothetical protein
LCRRAAIKTPTPDKETSKKFKEFVWNWLKHQSGLKPLCADEIFNFEEWLASAKYSADRKVELAELWNVKLGRKASRKLLRKVKCFVKDETYTEWKFPRGIYSRSDAAKCLFGPYVASVSKKVFALPWFIKNIPVIDRPKAIYDRMYKKGGRYVFTDYTAFESHFTKELLETADGQLYRFMFSKSSSGVKEDIAQFMDIKTGPQKMIWKMFDTKQDAGRMSGEMDTSLGNGFANLMLFLFALTECGYTIDEAMGYVEGDDGLFRVDGAVVPDEALFKKLGMTIKIGTTKNLSEASFCGQVYDVEEGVVVTDIKEVVCRLGWTNKRYTRAGSAVCDELLRSRGFSLAYQYGKCPILGVLGAKILELTCLVEVRESIVDLMGEWDKEKYLESVSYIDKHGLSVVAEPGPNTRALVEKLYDISIDEQIEIETKIKNMTRLGALPFRFRSEPKQWTKYYESYSVPNIDLVPTWIKADEQKVIQNLVSVKALTHIQAYRISRGGCGL